MLLSLDQFCSVCPHANVLYCDEGALIQHHIQEINMQCYCCGAAPITHSTVGRLNMHTAENDRYSLFMVRILFVYNF